MIPTPKRSITTNKSLKHAFGMFQQPTNQRNQSTHLKHAEGMSLRYSVIIFYGGTKKSLAHREMGGQGYAGWDVILLWWGGYFIIVLECIHKFF